jgi:protein TonB
MKQLLFLFLLISLEMNSFSQDTNTLEIGDPWFVEEPASFQGGDINTFNNWLKNNFIYPYEALQDGVYGKIVIQFSVDTLGNICDIKVLNDTHPALVEETFRVLKSSPKWEPAKQDAKLVKQNFVVPLCIEPQ